VLEAQGSRRPITALLPIGSHTDVPLQPREHEERIVDLREVEKIHQTQVFPRRPQCSRLQTLEALNPLLVLAREKQKRQQRSAIPS